MPEKGVEMKSIKLTILLFSFLLYGFLNSSTAQWVRVANGMGNRYVLSLAYSGNNIFAGINGEGVYLSTNNGTSWASTSLNDQLVNALAANGNNVFTGSYKNGVHLSTNNGTSWTQTSLNNQSVQSLVVNGNNIFAGAGVSGVYLSTNNGTTWTQTSLNNRIVHSLAANGNNIFAGTQTYGVYLSTDNGTTWAQSSLNNQTVRSLAVNGNNIFAGTGIPGNGVYLSTDNGTNWTQTSLNNVYAVSLAVNGNNVFAGTFENGVYVSNNNGASWIQKNEGFGADRWVFALSILNNYIFAGTNNSVYRRPLGELTGIQPISNEVPQQFSLSQNYPNPFNPKTVISYSLIENRFITLKVYDVLGNEVATLVNEKQNGGSYEVEFDGSKFSSGVYYYKLTAGEYSETKEMVLIK